MMTAKYKFAPLFCQQHFGRRSSYRPVGVGGLKFWSVEMVQRRNFVLSETPLFRPPKIRHKGVFVLGGVSYNKTFKWLKNFLILLVFVYKVSWNGRNVHFILFFTSLLVDGIFKGWNCYCTCTKMWTCLTHLIRSMFLKFSLILKRMKTFNIFIDPFKNSLIGKWVSSCLSNPLTVQTFFVFKTICYLFKQGVLARPTRYLLALRCKGRIYVVVILLIKSNIFITIKNIHTV